MRKRCTSFFLRFENDEQDEKIENKFHDVYRFEIYVINDFRNVSISIILYGHDLIFIYYDIPRIPV